MYTFKSPFLSFFHFLFVFLFDFQRFFRYFSSFKKCSSLYTVTDGGRAAKNRAVIFHKHRPSSLFLEIMSEAAIFN